VVPLEEIIRELKTMGVITRTRARGPYRRSPRARVDLYCHYGLPKPWVMMSSSEKERMVRLFIAGNLDHITPPGRKVPTYSFERAYELSIPIENQRGYIGAEVERLNNQRRHASGQDERDTIQNRINQLTDIQSVLEICRKGLLDRSLRW
jgi:hypothetical protein